MRRIALVSVLVFAALAAPAAARRPDVSLNVLPPGEDGGIPPGPHSTDQVPLYDSLTPLSGRHLSLRQVRAHYKPERFRPTGHATVEPTPRAGLTIKRDRWGVAHIYGKTRAAAFWGVGWVAGEDRALLAQLGRGAARAATSDVPGLDAFGLVTSGKTFTPSAQSEALLTRQQKLLVRRYGRKGRRMLRDMRAYAHGVTAQFAKAGVKQPPWTVNDEIAVTSFIGSIFGNGGGAEARNAQLLAQLRHDLGVHRGQGAWEDLMAAHDPEAPVTTHRVFRYGHHIGRPTPGSPLIDPGSLEMVPDPSKPRPLMSNFLVVGANRSANGNPLAVMGPQLGYYYPEIVFEADVHAPGILAQGIYVPGGGPYQLIGRTRNYAWSLTSASNDNRDDFVEQLCNPDGSPPTRSSDHYMYKGRCIPMRTFDAGTISGVPGPVTFHRTVHGSVVGTATVDGRPYAIALDRSTYGRDVLNQAAMHDMMLGRASTPRRFFRVANQFGFTFNWPYVSRQHVAYFSSGRLPVRAPGTNPMLPTLGTGNYDWRGFLSRHQHPHAIDPRHGLFLNWNNKPAKGWTSGDDTHYSAVHRVMMFRGFPKRVRVQDVVSIMNRAATQDLRVVRSWPVIRKVIAGWPAPDLLTQNAAALLTNWMRHGGHRLDRNGDGLVDDPGAAVMDEAWPLLARAVMRGGLGPDVEDAADVVGVGGSASSGGSSFGNGWWGYVSKDLRRLEGHKVRGPLHLRYCGGGIVRRCRAAIWGALQQAKDELVAEQGSNPLGWHASASDERITFKPGLIPDTMRWTNRPTFQQVLELTH